MMATRQEQPTLVQLAERMLEYAKTIEAAIGNPTSQNDTILNLPPELHKTRLEAIATSDKFNDLVRGSRGQDSRSWKYLHVPWLGQIAWSFIYNFRIPQAVPLDSSISYPDLARACNVHESDLRQVLRAAISIGLFYSPEPDHIAHTIDTRHLIEHPTTWDFLGYAIEQCSTAYSLLPLAIQKFPGSGEPNETAYSLHHRTDKPMYEHMFLFPDWPRRFGSSMQEFSTADAEQAGATILSYPFTGHETLIDVGGGSGHLSYLLTNHYPNINCIVQDLPSAAQPASSHPNVSFQNHNYFSPQQPPNPAGDIFLLSMILHNHSDKYAIEILRNLIPGLKPGAKILWLDRDLGRGLEQSQKTSLHLDMVMRLLFNAKERTLEEKIALLEKADPRFKYSRTIAADDSYAYTVTEVVWTP